MKNARNSVCVYLSRFTACTFTCRTYLCCCLCMLIVAVQRYTTAFGDYSDIFSNDISSGILTNQDTASSAAVNISNVTTVTLPVTSHSNTSHLIVTQVFNTSCPIDVLGLPNHVTSVCSKEGKNCQYMNLTCANLLSRKDGSDVLYKHAKQFMLRNTRKNVTDETLISLTADCGVFRRMRGFDKKAAIVEDIDFSIAYNRLVHRNSDMVSEIV